jgi:RNA polymerase sigma-70 factor (ECF subfamily)
VHEAELAQLHSQSLAWALACAGRDRDLARDVLQDAYCKVLEGRARFEGRSSFKTWFFGVIRNTARERTRWSVVRLFRPAAAAGSTDPASAPADPPAPSSEGPERALADRETAARLLRHLAALSPRQREVLHLVFYEEMSVSDAAVAMGVSVGTARLHYDRGKKALLARMQGEGEAPEEKTTP